ncbi:hypothetical protein KR009_003021 [Drosophila setifemur]|nr:hypothetical protein KR009_003021 [Drosophila setifemur]
MTRTQNATPRCGPITTLVVSIGRGETRITYADDSTRTFWANPLRYKFFSKMIDLGPFIKRTAKDYPRETAAFLERHFGRNTRIMVSDATHKRLKSMQLNSLIASGDPMKLEDFVRWHTWQLEQVMSTPAQRATIIDWKVPQTETLRILNFSWHLPNCVAWKLIRSNIDNAAKCYCKRTKKIMDKIKHLVNLETVEGGNCSSLVPALVEKMDDANDDLKKLKRLLELHKKRNRHYQQYL